MLVEPDNAEALAWGIRAAIAAGRSRRPRGGRRPRFTVEQSVDELLAVLAGPAPIPPATIVRQLEELVLLASSPPGRPLTG